MQKWLQPGLAALARDKQSQLNNSHYLPRLVTLRSKVSFTRETWASNGHVKTNIRTLAIIPVGYLEAYTDSDIGLYVFGLWEEAAAPREHSGKHKDTMQTPQKDSCQVWNQEPSCQLQSHHQTNVK